MEDELKCTKVIRIEDAPDAQGRPVFYHKQCGLPASECEIGGLLTKAKAVLCARHRKQADRQSFISQNGYPLGKVDKREKERGYHQDRLPGTGINDGL